MGLQSAVKSVYTERSGRTLRRVGVVSELVNGATVNLFTITGGPIIATMFGVVTAAGDGANATTVQLRNGATVMGLASGAITNVLVGMHLNPTGAVGVAIAISAGVLVGVYHPTNKWSLGVGTVNILVGGATQTALGAVIDWYLTWEPALPAATVAVV